MDALTELANRFGSDKASHGFCAFYDRLLAARRPYVTKVLEIGVLGGASLLMWRDYFPAAVIHGLDLAPRFTPRVDRVLVHQGDQASRRSLSRLLERTGGGFDLIVDDGGHTMEQQQVSLAFLFPLLRKGGMYVIEDLHTSFCDEVVVYRADGSVAERYPTGTADGGASTAAILEALGRQEPIASPYLSPPESDYLGRHVARTIIFDRDGDHAHMTGALLPRV